MPWRQVNVILGSILLVILAIVYTSPTGISGPGLGSLTKRDSGHGTRAATSSLLWRAVTPVPMHGGWRRHKRTLEASLVDGGKQKKCNLDSRDDSSPSEFPAGTKPEDQGWGVDDYENPAYLLRLGMEVLGQLKLPTDLNSYTCVNTINDVVYEKGDKEILVRN